jgi:hypothetical protein
VAPRLVDVVLVFAGGVIVSAGDDVVNRGVDGVAAGCRVSIVAAAAEEIAI